MDATIILYAIRGMLGRNASDTPRLVGSRDQALRNTSMPTMDPNRRNFTPPSMNLPTRDFSPPSASGGLRNIFKPRR